LAVLVLVAIAGSQLNACPCLDTVHSSLQFALVEPTEAYDAKQFISTTFLSQIERPRRQVRRLCGPVSTVLRRRRRLRRDAFTNSSVVVAASVSRLGTSEAAGKLDVLYWWRQ